MTSQPSQLSEVVPIILGSDGMARLPVEQLRDGKPHRFVWMVDDGKAVRFFMVDHYPDKLRFGVVFDACLLCGDQGYVMGGNRVIYIACGMYIFILSIDRAGDCNPVPIENQHDDEKELVILGKELVTGVNYLSTVMTIKIADPVDGPMLTSVSADYKYSYDGKIWFFSSETNYECFCETSEQFVLADMREG